MGLFGKMKDWFLTDEAKARAAQEKESKADVADTKKGSKKDSKADSERESKVDRDSEVTKKPVAKKVVKKRVIKVDKSAVVNGEPESVVDEPIEGTSLEDNSLEDHGSSETSIDELLDRLDNTLNDDGIDAYRSEVLAELEEEKKRERAQLLREERDRYYDIYLELPPYRDKDQLIVSALGAGIPEWYLREIGVVVDDAEFTELAERAVKQNEASDTGTVDDALEDTLSLDVSADSDRGFLDDAYVGDESIAIDVEDEVNVEDLSDVVVTNDDLRSSALDDVGIGADESVEIVESDTVADGVTKVTEDRVEDVVSAEDGVEASDSSDTFDELVFDKEEDTDRTADENISEDEVIEFAEEAPVDGLNQVSEGESVAVAESLSDRLSRLKSSLVTREVLKVDDDNSEVFVKESIADDLGTLRAKYSSYKLLDKESGDVSVGDTLDEDVKIEHVESKPVVGGVSYDVDSEEYAEILNTEVAREVWVLSTDEEFVSGVIEAMSGTRYVVRPLLTSKDFLMATRDVDNLIVITQKIPDATKASLSSFVAMIKSGEVRARVVSVSSSLVTADVIEETLPKVDLASLDDYYARNERSKYKREVISIVDMLKNSAYDLSNTVGEDVSLTDIGKDALNRDNGEFYISLDETLLDDDFVDIKMDRTGYLSNEFGDIDLDKMMDDE